MLPEVFAAFGAGPVDVGPDHSADLTQLLIRERDVTVVIGDGLLNHMHRLIRQVTR
ncbi:MAG: hypothetical protein R2706_07080 [Acidimicrobiales bacterium]